MLLGLSDGDASWAADSGTMEDSLIITFMTDASDPT